MKPMMTEVLAFLAFESHVSPQGEQCLIAPIFLSGL